MIFSTKHTSEEKSSRGEGRKSIKYCAFSKFTFLLITLAWSVSTEALGFSFWAGHCSETRKLG